MRGPEGRADAPLATPICPVHAQREKGTSEHTEAGGLRHTFKSL